MHAPADILCAVLRDGPAAELWPGWPPERWGELVGAARAHGVAGLLLRALAAAWPPEMPQAARDSLRAEARAVAGQNLRLYRLLADALAALGPSTPVVVLKGAALGPELYPAAALRPLTDIDLLVPPESVDAALAALAGIGFRALPALAPELARAVEPNVTLLGEAGGPATIDLHWGLVAGSADWRAAPVGWFWERSEPWAPPAALGAAPPARRLAPTAALLYQAAHIVLQHGRDPARLIWLYDLHLLAGCGRVNWGELVAAARAHGWAPALRAALAEAGRCFGPAAPPEVLAALGGRLDRRASFRGPSAAGAPPASTWTALGQLAAPARLRLLARVLLPSRAFLRASYAPAWGRWWPLAYPYRWLKPLRRLLARAAWGPR